MVARRSWSVALLALLGPLASCYSPRPQEGAPCNAPEQCPTGQRCLLGSCRLREPQSDAGVDATQSDAAVDALPDAMPCTADGLTCAGGTATAFPCGGHCWAYCPGTASWPSASEACTGWQGALGQVDDATEEACVIQNFAVTSWIGLSQSDDATTPGMGWTWNGKTDVVYTHWVSGKPDDGGGGEKRAEQCGKMQPDGQWDDAGCTQVNRFLCERP